MLVLTYEARGGSTKKKTYEARVLSKPQRTRTRYVLGTDILYCTSKSIPGYTKHATELFSLTFVLPLKYPNSYQVRRARHRIKTKKLVF